MNTNYQISTTDMFFKYFKKNYNCEFALTMIFALQDPNYIKKLGFKNIHSLYGALIRDYERSSDIPF